MIFFEPLIVIAVLFFINKKNYILTLKRKIQILIFTGVCFLIFSLSTNLKFVDKKDSNINLTNTQKIMQSIDVFSFRSAGYISDIIAYTNSSSRQLFDTKKHYIFSEIIYGVPLGSLFIPNKYKYKYSFDMEFHWTYDFGKSSDYISAPSALLFTLGFPITMILLFLIGSIQGSIFRYITVNLGNNLSWLCIHPLLIPFYMNGLSKSDLLGMIPYAFISYLVLKYLILKKERNIA